MTGYAEAVRGRISTRTAVRLAVLSLVPAVLLACPLVPLEPLRGDVVEGKGVMIGRGMFPDGTEWNIHARADRGLLCTSPWLSQGEQHRESCSGVDETGSAGGIHVGGVCGQVTFVDGSYDDSVAAVRVESTVGVHETPVVPLRAISLPSVAFGWAAPAGARVLAVTTFDASGAKIERLDVPPNPQCP
jgi:hypothetical protein